MPSGRAVPSLPVTDILIAIIGVLIIVILIYVDEHKKLDDLLKWRAKEVLSLQQRIEKLERERKQAMPAPLPPVHWTTNRSPPKKGPGR